MPRFAAAAVAIFVLFFALSAQAQTVYPIDRAEILAGARFDFKVEFPGLADPAAIKVTLNGEDYAKTFGKAAAFVEREDGKEQSALILHDVVLAQPGTYRVLVSNGTTRRELTWTVYGTGPRKAKNVVLLIGDGMSPAHRVAARLLAKGIAEGKARGKLAMDDMPQMALVATPGSDSVITDSANSASAYATATSLRSTRWECMPTALSTRSTIRRSRTSPAWCSAASAWLWASSPTPKSRMQHPRRWSRMCAAAPNTIASSSSSSPPSLTC